MEQVFILCTTFNPFSPASLINIYLLLTISIQNKLFCCENIGSDHTLQAIQYEKQVLQTFFKESMDTSYFAMFRAERLKIVLSLLFLFILVSNHGHNF